MRLIAAALFVFLGMLLPAIVMSATHLDETLPGWLIPIIVIPTMLVSIVAAMWLFNRKGVNPSDLLTVEERRRSLEELGLLESSSFVATRAFAVEEYEDEGPHYFIELDDGRVLYLCGQYLCDYEPIADDPDINQPRAFPCTEFTVRRHRTEQYVVEVACGGAVLEPEVVGPPFSKTAWKSGRVPEDGQVISGFSYEQLKREFAGAP